MRLGVGGMDIDRRLKAFRGQGEIVPGDVDVTQMEMGLGAPGIGTKGLKTKGLCLLNVAGLSLRGSLGKKPRNALIPREGRWVLPAALLRGVGFAIHLEYRAFLWKSFVSCQSNSQNESSWRTRPFKQ